MSSSLLNESISRATKNLADQDSSSHSTFLDTERYNTSTRHASVLSQSELLVLQKEYEETRRTCEGLVQEVVEQERSNKELRSSLATRSLEAEALVREGKKMLTDVQNVNNEIGALDAHFAEQRKHNEAELRGLEEDCLFLQSFLLEGYPKAAQELRQKYEHERSRVVERLQKAANTLQQLERQIRDNEKRASSSKHLLEEATDLEHQVIAEIRRLDEGAVRDQAALRHAAHLRLVQAVEQQDAAMAKTCEDEVKSVQSEMDAAQKELQILRQAEFAMVSEEVELHTSLTALSERQTELTALSTFITDTEEKVRELCLENVRLEREVVSRHQHLKGLDESYQRLSAVVKNAADVEASCKSWKEKGQSLERTMANAEADHRMRIAQLLSQTSEKENMITTESHLKEKVLHNREEEIAQHRHTCDSLKEILRLAEDELEKQNRGLLEVKTRSEHLNKQVQLMTQKRRELLDQIAVQRENARLAAQSLFNQLK